MTDEGTAGDGQDQGQPEGGSIFDPYLQSVPEGWDTVPQGSPRDVVANYLKDAEKGVNSKLRDAADLEKRFGPYKDIDLSQVQPGDLKSVVEWYSTVGQSPDAYKEWLQQEATEAGLIQAQQEAPAEDQDIEAYIQSRIDQALNPLQQKLTQFEQSQQESEQSANTRAMESHIESTLGKIESTNNIKLTDEQQEAILALGEQVEGDNWIEQGFQKYQALTGQAQAGLVKDKMGQPAPSLRTGGQAAPNKPKSFSDVREQALELMQNAL